MKLRYMLDTDMCIYIAKRKPPQAAIHFSTIAVGEIGISVITHGELSFGAAKSKRALRDEANLAAMLLDTPVLAIDERVSSVYGKRRAELAEKRMIIGGNDLWIGAHALALGLILVTNNEREFRRIEGLAIENWALQGTPAS